MSMIGLQLPVRPFSVAFAGSAVGLKKEALLIAAICCIELACIDVTVTLATGAAVTMQRIETKERKEKNVRDIMVRYSNRYLLADAMKDLWLKPNDAGQLDLCIEEVGRLYMPKPTTDVAALKFDIGMLFNMCRA